MKIDVTQIDSDNELIKDKGEPMEEVQKLVDELRDKTTQVYDAITSASNGPEKAILDVLVQALKDAGYTVTAPGETATPAEEPAADQPA